MKKIVVYSHDTFGLGNIRRMLAIIQHILNQYDDITILLISGSPVLHQLKLPRDRFDYLKLPCLARHQNGEYGVKSLSTGFNKLVALRAQAIKSTINEFQPDLVLVDKKPTGVADELLPAIQQTADRHPTTQWILLLRDILDHPDTTKRIWTEHEYHTVIERFYHSILVVGSKDIFDIRQEYDFPPAVSEKVVFCGYINRADIDPAPADRASLTRLFPGKKLVLVTPGGGEDGFQLIQTYLHGLQAEAKSDNLQSLIVTGPEMATDQQDQVRKSASNLPDVEIQTFNSDLLTMMQRADLVIAMAGYNTLCEILSLNKPAIVVPRTQPVEEQWIRAGRFAQRGWLTCIHPNDLTPTMLFDAVNSQLANPQMIPTAAGMIDFDGLPNVSRFIRNTLDDVTMSGEVKLYAGVDELPQEENNNPTSAFRAGIVRNNGMKKIPGFVDAMSSPDQTLPLLLASKR